jgi:hypothetical protein
MEDGDQSFASDVASDDQVAGAVELTRIQEFPEAHV